MDPVINDDPLAALAEGIKELSAGMKRVEKCGLSRNAIVTLIHASLRQGSIGKRDIDAVLDSLRDLEDTYCKP